MPEPGRASLTETPATRLALIAAAVAVLALLVGLPLVVVFVEALRRGVGVALSALADPDALAAIGLTVTVAAVAVPLNTAFGLAAAWAITKFEFRGKTVLVSLIDLPLSVSPVVAGLVYVLLFGARGLLGPLAGALHVSVLFALPGIVLATTFVTLPFVARQLVPLMQARGSAEEEAAVTLGAGGWRVFWTVTLPNVRWALLYGVLLCNARAMGEFGAVSIVSGHIRGQTDTLPLHVEVLYNDYDFVGAFAAAACLAGLAIVTLVAKTALELWYGDALAGDPAP